MICDIIEYAGILWLKAYDANCDIYLHFGDDKYIQLKPWLELVLKTEIYHIYVSDDKTTLTILISSQIKLNDLNSIFIDLNNVVIGCYEDEEHNTGIKLIVNLKEE